MSSTRDHSLAGVLSIVSYSLAAVTLTAGLILTVAIASTAGDIPNLLSGVRGLGPFLSPLAEPISTGVELVAVAIFVLGVLAGALWLALGALLATVHTLGRRVRLLEGVRSSESDSLESDSLESDSLDPSQHVLRTP